MFIYLPVNLIFKFKEASLNFISFYSGSAAQVPLRVPKGYYIIFIVYYKAIKYSYLCCKAALKINKNFTLAASIANPHKLYTLR